MCEDNELGEAIRDLEESIGALRCMMSVLELVTEDAIGNRADVVSDRVKAALPEFRDYVIHILTEDQSDGLHYALAHMGDLVRNLHSSYHDALKRQTGKKRYEPEEGA